MNIRYFIDLFEEIEEDYTLYHGTSESVDTIASTGLIPDRHGAVFLTDNPQLAIEYAETDQERTGLDNLTLVSINVRSLDHSKLAGDMDHTNLDDWQESLKETDQCMYFGSIPPSLLTIKEL